MITPGQIRAARGLINWSQSDLAERTGMSILSIGNIELGKQKPSAKTQDKIINIFSMVGIEFTDNEGIRKKEKDIEEFEGSEGFKLFLDEVYESAKDKGGEFCILNGLQSYWDKWLDADWYNKVHVKRMNEIKDKIDFKIIGQEGEHQTIGLGYTKFRWFPKDIFSEKASFYSFGKKLAFLDFHEDNIRIFVLKRPEFATGFRILFNVAWQHLAILPDQ